MESIRAFAAGSAGTTSQSTLSWGETVLGMSITAGVIIAIGLIVVFARSRDTGQSADTGQSKDTGQSVVRSWIALAQVAGLVLFCAVTLAINAPDLRSTLFGGLTTSVGAAVAFYFSSKASDQARQDILQAMQQTAGGTGGGQAGAGDAGAGGADAGGADAGGAAGAGDAEAGGA